MAPDAAGQIADSGASVGRGQELARSHGVCQTAQVLRLEYKKLKQFTGGETGRNPIRRRRAPARATFVELAPPATAATECVIELEGPRGKLRIQWKGAAATDLAGLSRVLWESA